MIGSSKEKIRRDGFRCQSARSDRDPHRVCTSKLSKKELEDLYFSLMETNLQLKKTVNAQQDNIKMLNTRVQRLMAVQRSSANNNTCCAPTKAVVLEQKDTIADLKNANDRLSERIRILNMRLCSAKQFLKRCPSQANARCFKCCTAPPVSLRNSSVSMIHSKRSEIERKPSVSPTQATEKPAISTRTIEAETDEGEQENESRTICKENKCRSLIEELKQKIIDLQEESSKYQQEWSARLSRLESEVCRLQADNARLQRERTAWQQGARLATRREERLADQLRAAEAQHNDVTSQLLIEKSKVAELETRVKAADLATQAVKELEKRHKLDLDDSVTEECSNRLALTSPSVMDLSGLLKDDQEKKESENGPCKLSPLSVVDASRSPNKSKHSDDSGYMDNQRGLEDEALAKINKELEKKITELQAQLDTLRIESAGLKSERPVVVSEATNVEMTTDANTKPDKTLSSNATNARTKDMETKRIGDPEEAEIDVHRVNEKPAKTAGDGVKQKEERIQFMTPHNERSPQIIRTSTPTRLNSPNISPDTSKARNRTETSKNLELKGTDIIHEKSTDNDERNKLDDKIVDTASVDVTAHPKTKFNTQTDIETHKLEDGFKAVQELFKHNIKSSDNFRRETKLKQGSANSNENSEDLKQDANLQNTNDAKIHFEDRRNSKVKDLGVKILDKCIRRSSKDSKRESKRLGEDKYKHADKKGRRESQTEKKERVVAQSDMNNQYDTKKSYLIDLNQNKSDDECVGSDSIHLPVGPSPRRCVSACCVPADDTDHEISHLSDLPPERDDKSPRSVLSPGEQRTTPTYTDTYTKTSTDLPTLSEGEMLVSAGRRRSLGEAKYAAVEAKTDGLSVSQQMEEALQSIGEELARCRQMLQHQRELEMKQTEEASTNSPSHVALRRSPGTPLLAPAAAAPCKCSFVLHIGTLVLSDEAVIHSRDKCLLLTWKFYEQSVAMTRMRGGRVVVFDFTVEYDADMDERFVGYLKNEGMPIIICELNKQICPFVSCKLPLRKVLINANRRVDMSLPMTMGPDMRKSMAAHSAVGRVQSDEVGVLDLWCMLRKPVAHADLRRVDELSTPPPQSIMGLCSRLEPEKRQTAIGKLVKCKCYSYYKRLSSSDENQEVKRKV